MDSTAVEHAHRPENAAVQRADRPDEAAADQNQSAATQCAVTEAEVTEDTADPAGADADPAAGDEGGAARPRGASPAAQVSQDAAPAVAAAPVSPTSTVPSDYDRNRALGIRVIAFVIALCVLVTGWALTQVAVPGSPIVTTATGPRHVAAPPAPRLVQQLAGTVTIPGSAPAIPWPSVGQAAVEMDGYGPLGTSGAVTTPVPIASVAKTMTAYLILAHHPLAPGESGPLITVGSAEAGAYQSEKKQGQSLVKVYAGERISERDALEALMLASADNIAKILARWDAGSVPAFVRAMNGAARGLGMSRTTYTDPSGLDPATVSTAPDQVKLGQAAMRSAAFRAIVGQQSASVPVEGTIWNFNRLAGHDGVTGIKTGSTDQAGGCLLFADTVTLGGREQTVIGAVLGQPLGTGGGFLDRTLSAASKLIAAAQGTLAAATVAMPGDQVAAIRSGGPVKRQTPLGVAEPLVLVGRPGQAYRVSISWDSATPMLTVTALGPTAPATTGSLSVPLVRTSPRGALPAG